MVVAENCNFQVAFYDPDGKSIKKFGKRATSESDGFGSCCNPMNVCCQGDDVLTAESSIGHIKRFNANGELVAFIGTAPIGGGCKHVALAHDKLTDRYFMFNEDRKCISVLVPKSASTGESDDERAARIAMAGLGQNLIGVWQAVLPEKNDNTLVDFIAKKYGRLPFGEKGELRNSSLSDNTSIQSNALATLAKLSGSQEAAEMLAQPAVQSRWTAIEQMEKTLRIGFFEDGVAKF